MAHVKTFYKSKSGNTYLAPNFKVGEFACKDGTDKLLVDLDMLYPLQLIREILGSITINSAYRTEAWNRKQGGASNSYHLYGRAFDIVDAKRSLTAICNIAYTLGIKGIIRYPSFVHIDSRANKYHANNNGSYLVYNHYNIPFKGTMKYGATGIYVGCIQFKLKSLGYNVTIDGIYGRGTESVIKQFQKDSGFYGKDIDGIVGKMTWNKLF